jgi:hypothetical protein
MGVCEHGKSEKFVVLPTNNELHRLSRPVGIKVGTQNFFNF